MRPLYMSYLTAPVPDPLQALSIARTAGYDGLGLRLCDPATGLPASPLVGNIALTRRFRDQLCDCGLIVPEIEARILTEATGPFIAPAVLELAAELGAPDLIAVGPAGGSVDIDDLCDRFAALCEQAECFGLKVGFEPIAHRAGGDPGSALRIVAAGRDRGARIVLDALHVERMGMAPADLAAVDRDLMAVFHICDVPPHGNSAEVMMDHSARNRWPPGEGNLPLLDYLDALPDLLPLSVEIPMDRHAGKMPPGIWAARCIAATRRLLAAEQAPRNRRGSWQ